MPPNDPQLAMLAQRVDALHDGFSEVRSTLKEVADALVILARVDERQGQANAAIDRAFKAIEKTDGRVDKLAERVMALEQQQPLQKQVNLWFLSGVWTVAGLAVMFVAKTLHLI